LIFNGILIVIQWL